MKGLLVLILVGLPLFAESSGLLEFYAIPVGQGDGGLLICPDGKKILFDLGSSAEGNIGAITTFMKNHLPLDEIVISHPDADHFNILTRPGFLSGRETVFLGGHISDYPASFLDQIPKANRHVYPKNYWGGPTEFEGPSCSGVKIEVLAANNGDSANQKSIVVRIDHGEFSMLLTGDFESSDMEKQLIAHHCAPGHACKLHVSLLKVSHHGAVTQANSAEILNAISPMYAYVSTAYPPGKYGHPRCEVFSRLESHLVSAEVHHAPCWNSASQVVVGSQLFKAYFSTTIHGEKTKVTQQLLHWSATGHSSHPTLSTTLWTTPRGKTQEEMWNPISGLWERTTEAAFGTDAHVEDEDEDEVDEPLDEEELEEFELQPDPVDFDQDEEADVEEEEEKGEEDEEIEEEEEEQIEDLDVTDEEYEYYGMEEEEMQAPQVDE